MQEFDISDTIIVLSFFAKNRKRGEEDKDVFNITFLTNFQYFNRIKIHISLIHKKYNVQKIKIKNIHDKNNYKILEYSFKILINSQTLHCFVQYTS